MIQLRKAGDRGQGQFGWLEARYTFSFNTYNDPDQMGFRVLRVMNEDRVAPSKGFGTHGHRDMEILTYVLEGALEHRDSLGNGEILRPGEVQVMTAGTGIEHSEFNPSDSEPVHLYQIWIRPDRRGHAPRYDQKPFPESERAGRLRVVASPDGRDGSLMIHQDALVSLAAVGEGDTIDLPLAPGRHGWIQVLRGAIRLGDHELSEGDGAAISEESELSLTGLGPGEAMIFDLP